MIWVKLSSLANIAEGHIFNYSFVKIDMETKHRKIKDEAQIPSEMASFQDRDRLIARIYYDTDMIKMSACQMIN